MTFHKEDTKAVANLDSCDYEEPTHDIIMPENAFQYEDEFRVILKYWRYW